MPEMYTKLVNNYAENTIAMSRIFNDMAFLDIEVFKNVVDNTKKQSKQLAEIGKRNVSVYERIEQTATMHYYQRKKIISLKIKRERR